MSNAAHRGRFALPSENINRVNHSVRRMPGFSPQRGEPSQPGTTFPGINIEKISNPEGVHQMLKFGPGFWASIHSSKPWITLSGFGLIRPFTQGNVLRMGDPAYKTGRREQACFCIIIAFMACIRDLDTLNRSSSGILARLLIPNHHAKEHPLVFADRACCCFCSSRAKHIYN